jgi:hypothetical protein
LASTAWAERDHRPRRQRRHDGHDRRDQEQPAARCARLNDFLEQQLQHVGDRLQQTGGTDAVRPETHVHPADQLALPQRQVGDAQQDHDGTTRMRTSAHTVGHATPRSWARPR